MKNRYLTLIALVIVALVGLFTVGRVEAVDGLLGPTHTDLQNQHNDQKNQHNAIQSQHTNLQNQHNAIQSQLGEASPPWSQDLPAAERFVSVLGGAAVVDRETELVWEMAPDTNTRN